jgi:hypothetical protein
VRARQVIFTCVEGYQGKIVASSFLEATRAMTLNDGDDFEIIEGWALTVTARRKKMTTCRKRWQMGKPDAWEGDRGMRE